MSEIEAGEGRGFERAARSAIAGSVVVAVLCLIAVVSALIATAPRSGVASVQVFDEASVLNTASVERQIGALATHRPVRVVVWTRAGSPSDDLGEEALAWADSRPAGLLHSAAGAWTDGLLFIAVSVDQRGASGGLSRVETRFGPDVEIRDAETLRRVENSGFTDFLHGRWDEGVVGIAETAAAEMGRPVRSWTGPVIGASLVLLLAAGANLVSVLAMRARFRRAVEDLACDAERPEVLVAASRIPAGSRFGARIAETARAVSEQRSEGSRLRAAIDARRTWAVNAANPGLWDDLGGFARIAGSGREASEALSRATGLYEGGDPCVPIWDEEIEEAARALRDRDDRFIRAKAGPELEADLAGFCEDALQRLGEIGARAVDARGEDALRLLEEIAEIRDGLSARMAGIEQASTGALLSRGKAEEISAAIAKERAEPGRRPQSVTGFYDRENFYPPVAFVRGYDRGRRRHRARRNAVLST
ncbi:MAG: DUF5129 domain-containing protein [Leucobacter sp.]